MEKFQQNELELELFMAKEYQVSKVFCSFETEAGHDKCLLALMQVPANLPNHSFYYDTFA
jgi:hypothetical protein